MRNLLEDEKLLEKSAYTSMNCLRVFGFYISSLHPPMNRQLNKGS